MLGEMNFTFFLNFSLKETTEAFSLKVVEKRVFEWMTFDKVRYAISALGIGKLVLGSVLN